MKYLAAAALIACLTGVAGAQTTVPAKKADPDKRICHRETSTGSYLAKSVCHTRAEWDAIERANAGSGDRLRDTMRIGDTRPS